jgi:hypothetical protein
MEPFDIFTYLPDHYRTGPNTVLGALLSSIKASQDILVHAVQSAIDQQFLTTATGKHLLFLGEQSGFVLPANSGLDIRALRSLVPIAVANPRQVADTLIKLVETFYGVDKVRANIMSSTASPYGFIDGDELSIETESETVNITLSSKYFSNINSVSAAEFVTFINTSQNKIIADVFQDLKTNNRYVRLASKTRGLGSYIRVSGGTCQNVLRFPHLVATTNGYTTEWTAQKLASHTDVVRVAWTGNGKSPKVYKASAGDVVSIRGLSGDAEALNGSYVLKDVGYDYFVVLAPRFLSLSAMFTEPSDYSIVFTSQDRSGVYGATEYAFVAETAEDSVAVTVPAVPPIARRFLKGSTHLHGDELPVLDFTRSTITIDNSLIPVTPTDVNSVVLVNSKLRYAFSPAATYKLAGSDRGFPRVFITDYSDSDYAVLPHTSIEPVSLNSIDAEINSENYYIKFPYPHGIRKGWGFTLNVDSAPNYLSTSSLNKEHVCAGVVDPHTVLFHLKTSDGKPIRHEGVRIGPVEVIQVSTDRDSGADFYIEFNSISSLINSGIRVGQKFRIDQNSGISRNAFYTAVLQNHNFEVTEISGNRAYFCAGYGVGNIGTVMSGVFVTRNGGFGGNVKYFVDKASDRNQTEIFDSLRALFTEYTPAINPKYVGSFLFDPLGLHSTVTVSNVVVKNAAEILKGSSQISIFIEDPGELPDNGSLMINYGTDNVEGPISYLSVINNEDGYTQIIIDPSYRFKHTHKKGAYIWHVAQKSPFLLDMTGKHFPAYLTGTAQARNTLFEILKLLVASGIFIDFNVLLPTLKYADPSIKPFA